MTAITRSSSPLPLAAAAFLRKEAFDVLRQPRLLVTLVLGPFLILLAFGVGYRDEMRPFRTVFVGDPGAALTEQIRLSAERLGPLVQLDDVVDDEREALRRLEDGEVDAVVVLPADPLGDVTAGRQAVLRVLHTRLDPVELTIIGFASRLAVAQVNATVLATLVSEAQGSGVPVAELLAQSSDVLDGAVAQIDAGDLARAESDLAGLEDQLRRLDISAASIEALTDQQGTEAGDAATDTASTSARSFGQAVDDARLAVVRARRQLTEGNGVEARAELTRAQEAVRAAPALADELMAVDADVLVQPFAGEVSSTAPGRRTFTDYYAPAAVVLLLQQFGVAFAALSFVRERQLGASELYRVAPVGPRQVVIGKYLGHLVIGGLVALVLTVLITAGLGVPLVGELPPLVVTLGLTVLASIGLGFLISLTSRTDMQAVLSTMLVLLAALFFSGFFLSVDQLEGPARALSWAIPATYGISEVRDIMLRGDALELEPTLALLGYSFAAMAIVYTLTRRQMSTLA